MLGPIPYWLLGGFALVVVWCAALLCAAASVRYARMLGKRARAITIHLREGVVASGLGEGGVFAVHEIEQIGRAMDGDPPTIVFSDKTYQAKVFGGVIEANGETLEIAPLGSSLEVWPDASTQLAQAAVEGDDALDALYKDARSAKGAPRTVTVPFSKGKKVYFTTAEDGALAFLSSEDPRPFFSERRRAHVLFALAELVICGGLTALALFPPAFGAVSTVGGVGLLAFFLSVQPIGVSVEEASREPFRRFLRGVHKRSVAFPGGVVPGRTTTQVQSG